MFNNFKKIYKKCIQKSKHLTLLFVCVFFVSVCMTTYLLSNKTPKEINAETIDSGVDTITMDLTGDVFTVTGHGTLTNFKWKDYYTKVKTLIFVPTSETEKIIAPADCEYMFAPANRTNTYLESIDLSGLDTSSVTNMSHMFDNCYALNSIDLSCLETTGVTDMSYMFSGWRGTNLDLTFLDTSDVLNMEFMFQGCSGLTTLDVSSLDTSNVLNMKSMFKECSKLTSLILGNEAINIDTSNVTDMSEMFSGCSTLTSLDISALETVRVTDMSAMFYNCNKLTDLDISTFNTENLLNMDAMFSKCSSLTSLDLSDINTSNVDNMHAMFNECSALETINLTNFETNAVTNMSSMFYGCKKLLSLDLSSFDTLNVTTMSSMFCDCKSLTGLDVSHLDTDNVMYMNSMFEGCSGLTTLDLSSFNTSNVIHMQDMFNSCSNLETINLTNFETNAVTNMSHMFYGCKKLSSLDLSSFNTINVKEMNSMFGYCENLTEIIGINDLDTSNVTTMGSMFNACKALESLDISNLNTEKVTSMQYMFYGCTSLNDIDLGIIETASLTSAHCMFYNCKALTNITLINNNNTIDTGDKTTSFSSMFSGCDLLTNVNLSNFDASDVSDLSSMFVNCTSLVTVDLSCFNQTKISTVEEMFKGCTSLKNIDLSTFDTADLKNLSYMFSGCTNLESVVFENVELAAAFDLPAATKLSYMFQDCSKITELDLSCLKPEKATNISSMFSGCIKLESIDLTDFYIPKVTNMSSVFSGCSAITSLDLSYFKPESVTNIASMFKDCSNLRNIDLENFNAPKLSTVIYTFEGCSSLESLDLSGFNTTNVLNMNNIFKGCSSLEELNLNNFETPKVNSISSMFEGCTSLEKIDLEKFDVSSLTNAGSAFKDCSSLKKVDLSLGTSTNLTTIKSMFSGCTSLEEVDISSFDFTKMSTGNYTYYSSMFHECTSLKRIETPYNNTRKIEFPVTLYKNDDNTLYTQLPTETTVSYTLLAPNSVDIANEIITIQDIAPVVYDKTEQRPDVILKYDNDETLVVNSVYTLEYTNNVNVGQATVTITGIGPYYGTRVEHFQITQRPIIYNAEALDKNWDGNKEATIKINYVSGIVENDDVELSDVVIGEFATSEPEEDINITLEPNAAPTLQGADKDNYYVEPVPLPLSADIILTSLQENLIGNDLGSEEYRGTEITKEIVLLKIARENYDVTYTNNVNVGEAIVTITGKNGITGTLERKFLITPYKIDIDMNNYDYALTKEYDKTNVVHFGEDTKKIETVNGINGETLNVEVTGTYNDVTASDEKTVTLEANVASVTGGNKMKENYTLNVINNEKEGIITKKLLTYKAVVNSKPYDGNTNATITISDLEGMIEGDNVSIEQEISGTFETQNVGTDIIVTPSKTPELLGDTKGNYYINPITETLKANIRNLELRDVVTVDPVSDQTYTGLEIKPTVVVKDGETELIEGTHYKLSYKDNINAGVETGVIIITGKTPYEGSMTVNFTIKPKDVTLNLKDLAGTISKTYDGNLVAYFDGNESKSAEVDGENGEILNINITGTYNDKTASDEKTVTLEANVASVTGGCEMKENYNVIFNETSAQGIITKKLLTYKAVANSKPYDGNTNATITISDLEGMIEGDNVSIEQEISGTFASNDAGEGIAVTTEIVPTLLGADSGNYMVNKPAGLTATIRNLELRDVVTVEPVSDQTYTGLEIKPTVVVKDGETELIEGTHYKLSYEDNTNAGVETGVIIVTGKTPYEGSMTVNFTIKPMEIKEENINSNCNETIVKERDGDSSLTSEDKEALRLTFTNINTNDKVNITFTDAKYTKEGIEVIKADNDETKFLDITAYNLALESSDSNNYILVANEKALANKGRIVDTVKPTIISIKAEKGTYNQNQTIRFVLKTSEPVKLSSSEVKLIVKGKDGNNKFNIDELRLIYSNENEDYSDIKYFTYQVQHGDFALNGLNLESLELNGVGFVDECNNELIIPPVLAQVENDFSNTFIETKYNDLTITTTGTNVKVNEANEKETSDLSITYKFIFGEEITSTSFEKEDITILIDGNPIDENLIEELVKVNNKTYTLKINNTGIITSSDKEGKVQTVKVAQGVTTNALENTNKEAEINVRIKRTLKNVTSNYSSGRKLLRGTEITLKADDGAKIYYKTLEDENITKEAGDRLVITLDDNTTKLLDVYASKDEWADSDKVNFEYIIKTQEDNNDNNDNNNNNVIIDKATQGTQISVKEIDHKSYMIGFKDGTFRPNEVITRGEVAAIISRISSDYSDNKNYKSNIKYTDVSSTLWSSNYIGYLANIGIIEGFKDETFKPNANMTRAEFVTILSRYLKLTDKKVTLNKFADIKGSWYENNVNVVTSYIDIVGLPNGTFGGDEFITRAEICKIINSSLSRKITNEITKTYVAKVTNKFKDVNPSSWYFKEVLEATVDHNSHELH